MGEATGDISPRPENNKPEISPAVQKLAGIANNVGSPDSPRDPTIQEWKDLFLNIRENLDLPSSQNVAQLLLEGYIGKTRRSLSSNGEPLTKGQEASAEGLSTEIIEVWFKEGLINNNQVITLDKAYGDGRLQRLKNF